MNPIIFIIISMVAYAIGNHLIETRCAQYAAAVTTTITSAVILCISVAIWVYQWKYTSHTDRTNVQLVITSPVMILTLVLLGVILWAGDYFSFAGYSYGASAFTVSTMMLLVPVLVSLIDHVTKGGWPSLGLCMGYCFAATGGVLVALYGGEK